jgi:hypothetical protein
MDGTDDLWVIDTPDTSGIAFDNDGDGNPDEFMIGTDSDGDGQLEDLQFFQPTDEDGHFDELQLEGNNTSPELMETNINESSFVSTNQFEDTEHWRQQSYDDTCGIVAQEFILDDIGQDYGIDFSEDELRDTATACGWYTPGGGTPMLQVGNLLEAYGIGVERSYNASLDDINQQLEAEHKVLVAVDSDEIWYPDNIDDDDLIANLLGMPGQEPNHTVQVIGINNSDPSNPMVILNDPGTPDGRGLTVPADDFLNAWEDSNNFMVATTDRNLDPNATQFAVNNSNDVNGVLLGSFAEGDYQKSWGDSYQYDADYARDWAERYGKDGNVDKVLEFEKKAAEAQEKADERYRKAQEEYRNV